MKYSYLGVRGNIFNGFQPDSNDRISQRSCHSSHANLCLMSVHDLLPRRFQGAVSLLAVELQFVIRQKFMKNFGEIYSWLSEAGIR